MQLLTGAGVGAIEQVAAAATSDSPEVSWRAGEVLQRIALSGDEQTLASVCRAMEQLAPKHERFARQAADLTSQWREFRHGRAARRFQELGGRLHEPPYGEVLTASAFSPTFLAPEMIAIDSYVIPATDAAEPEPPLITTRPPDLRSLSSPEMAPLLERALGEEEPEIVRTRKVEVDVEPAGVAPTDDPYADPPTLEPVAEDVPGAEIPAEVIESAAESLEVDGITMLIDTTELYDVALSSTGIASLGLGGEGRVLEIGPDWKGSDDDLRLLRELNDVTRVVVAGRPFTSAALREIEQMQQLKHLSLQQADYDIKDLAAFKRQRPEVAVQAFGPGMLGVSGEPTDGGFRITHLVAGSAAAQAGVRQNDVITRIDGLTTLSFETLSWIVAARKVGDPVEVEVRRGDETLSRRVKLGAR